MANRSALKSLVDSVADGDEPDWEALEAQFESEHDRKLFQQLRILAQISHVHRSQPDVLEGDAAPARSKVARLDRRRPRPIPDPPAAPAPESPAGTLSSNPAQGTPSPAPAPVQFPIASDPSPGDAATAGVPARRWGSLTLLERVGEGSFGEVYRAFDNKLEREVALKLLHVGRSPTRQASQALKEARILARLRHPNVVVVHGAERHDQRVGMWMEFIQGSTLEKLLRTHGPFSAAEAARIGQDLARALGAVHASGLVHRDIKTQNVIRETGGRVVLMDFGAGQWRDDRKRGTVGMTGTPLYLSPEVLTGGEATVSSDIYSLGVLLYHLVTNDFPVRGKSLDDLKEAHRAGRRRSLHDARHDLPDGFVQTVERAIDPDPARRFASAGEMLAALRQAQAIPVTADEGPGLLQAGVRWMRAHRWAVAAVVLAALAGVTWVASRRPASTPVGTINSMAVVLDGEAAGQSGVLAAGFAEGLRSALGKIEGLSVTQWSTSSELAARRPAQAGATLDVDAIIALAVDVKPPAGGRGDQTIDVRARILRGGTQEIGVETVSGVVPQMAPLQASLAAALANRAGVALTARDRQRLQQRARPVNPDAFVEFVKGVQRSLKRDELGLREAMVHYNRAIHLDPDFAAAHAARSEAYSLLGGNFGAYPAELAADAATGAAMKAIELDDTLVDGWVALGFAKFYLHWDWAGAEAAFQRAIALNPAHAMARHYYGNFLNAIGRQDEGLQQRLLARERDPNSLVFTRGVAWNYFYMRRYADAARELEAAAAVDPDNAAVNSLLARAYYALNRHDEGIALMQELVSKHGPVSYVEKLAFGLASAGRHDETRALLRKIEELSHTTYIKPYDVALVHVQLGEHETALALLEQAFDQRDSTIVSLKVDPRLDAIRDDPRFRQLLARMGY